MVRFDRGMALLSPEQAQSPEFAGFSTGADCEALIGKDPDFPAIPPLGGRTASCRPR